MEKEFYTTSDLNLAATLLELGYDIEGIDPRDPDRVLFYFDPEKVPESKKDVVSVAAKAYWNGAIKVDPRDFMNRRKELVSRVKESQRDFRL